MHLKHPFDLFGEAFSIRYRWWQFWDDDPKVGFSGQYRELPTAISQGKTLEELEENIKDAIQSVLDIQEDRF